MNISKVLLTRDDIGGLYVPRNEEWRIASFDV